MLKDKKYYIKKSNSLTNTSRMFVGSTKAFFEVTALFGVCASLQKNFIGEVNTDLKHLLIGLGSMTLASGIGVIVTGLALNSNNKKLERQMKIN